MHGGGDIQRTERLVAGDVQKIMATFQFFVAQPGAFTTKQNGGFEMRRIDDFNRALLRRKLRPCNPAQAGARPDDQLTVGQRIIKRFKHLGIPQNIFGPGGAGIGIVARENLGCHQTKISKPHVLHGTGNRADITGMGGGNQQYANIRQQVY